MKKNLVLLLIVAVLCSGMAFAANGYQSGTIGATSGEVTKNAGDVNPTLEIQWNLVNDGTYNIGFSESAVTDGSSVTAATVLELATDRAGGAIKGTGKTNVYWQLNTAQPVNITLKGSGPMILAHTVGQAASTNRIAWEASWTPYSVNAEGSIVSDESVKIGNASTTARDDTKEVYERGAKVWNMDSTGAAKGNPLRNGSTEITVVTEDVSQEPKDNGNYSASLILTIEAGK